MTNAKPFRILVVEDERDILEMVTYNLRREGFRVQEATSGEAAMRYLATDDNVDLVLLDLMLPGASGFEVCQLLRQDPKTARVPIIMLTARGDETDVVRGLELGADDYVTKPFSPRVLIARVAAVLRRRAAQAPGPDEPLRVGELFLHPGRHEVTVAGEPVRLTQTEFRTLHVLMTRVGWVCTRAQIVEALHDGFTDVTERSVDVQIVGLRRKLGAAGAIIETVRGVGYRIVDPGDAAEAPAGA
ncbi:MAG: DNA-binding response regulator [Candidatus Dadabacteria bacterium]|nr:MAG: DNA-binding response regulator [Candidatus Dadabacteria bacterium]